MKKFARLRSSPSMSEDLRHQGNKNVMIDSGIRTTGRIKKPKAVFDPSDNYLPKSQRLSFAFSPQTTGGNNNLSKERRHSIHRASTETLAASKDICVVCGKRESKRTSFALKNPLVSCVECDGKIHRQCLKTDFDDFEQIRQTYKCSNCTICDICQNSNHASELADTKIVICTKCSKNFHLLCLPKKSSSEDPGLDWKCPKCELEIESTKKRNELPVKKTKEIIGDQSRSPLTGNKTDITLSPQTDNTSSKESTSNCTPQSQQHDDGQIAVTDGSCEVKVNEASFSSDLTLHTEDKPCNQLSDEVPDVRDWSVDQVHNYFLSFFPKEAYVFKDQEIDGRSLLLLKRSDIVKKLPLKLGPSLRIYSFILKLQGQSNDPTLGWNCRF